MASSTSTVAAASAPAPAGFEFPREYYFPPFFTRQTNLNTHHAQLVKWSSLVLSYCQHHRIFKLPLSPVSSTSTTAASLSNATPTPGSNPSAAAEDIFFNRKLNRRLALADVREVIDFMRKDGRAEYVGGGEGPAAGVSGAGGDVVWVYWRTPEEWAALVEGWVDETAQKGTVLTLYELTEGEGTRGTGKLRPYFDPRADSEGETAQRIRTLTVAIHLRQSSMAWTRTCYKKPSTYWSRGERHRYLGKRIHKVSSSSERSVGPRDGLQDSTHS